MTLSALDSKRMLHSGHTIAGNGAIKHRIGLRGGPVWHCESRVRTFVGSRSLTGEELKRWRKIVGYTQQQAGAELDVTRATIQNWERESTAIPMAVELAIRFLVRCWKQRPEFGPVALAYVSTCLEFATPSSHDMATMICQRFSNNQDVFRHLADRMDVVGAVKPIILDEEGVVIWSGSELMKECARFRSQQLHQS